MPLQLNEGYKDSGIKISNPTSKQFCQDQLTKPTPYTQHLACIKRKTPASANVIYSIFTSLSVPKFYIYIVTVLPNLNVEYDDLGLDELLFLRKAVASPYLKDFVNVIYVLFLSHIENDTWEY